MNQNWISSAIYYHIYPLGFCGAPRFAYEETTTTPRILKIIDWIDHLKQMNVNAVYLGPVFASYEHGYDTSDYRMIDRRLGTNEDFKKVCDALHEAHIKIVLDGVFNHVGREFWAFLDVIDHKENSPYRHWFHGMNFHNTSPYGDPFTYEAWEGHYNLVKLNLQNEDVVNYLLESVGMWMEQFHIDGLRLDAADCIDKQFFRRLKAYTKERDSNFWLMGEIIHGDYSLWANKELLDSVTNYECYKGLFSAHNTKNYFEIAYSLNRQYGNGGIYKDLLLYNFVDNHDVNRLASVISRAEDLFNVYTMLFTMPGIPSIYYGSEFAIQGTKHNGSDADIRPCLSLSDFTSDSPLYSHICKLGALRSEHIALQGGSYEQVCVRNEQLIYCRHHDEETIYVALNLADEEVEMTIDHVTQGQDLLTDKIYNGSSQGLPITIAPHGSMIIIDHVEVEKSENKETADAMISVPITEVNTSTLPKIGRYRHFKGNIYSLLYIAKHSETLEDMAVYRQLYGDGSVWVRPCSMFTETVMVDGEEVPRFRYIGK